MFVAAPLIFNLLQNLLIFHNEPLCKQLLLPVCTIWIGNFFIDFRVMLTMIWKRSLKLLFWENWSHFKNKDFGTYFIWLAIMWMTIFWNSLLKNSHLQVLNFYVKPFYFILWFQSNNNTQFIQQNDVWFHVKIWVAEKLSNFHTVVVNDAKNASQFCLLERILHEWKDLLPQEFEVVNSHETDSESYLAFDEIHSEAFIPLFCNPSFLKKLKRIT